MYYKIIEMQIFIHINMHILFYMNLHICTHKTCSKHLWMSYSICFDHNILHKQSKLTLKELEKTSGVFCPV